MKKYEALDFIGEFSEKYADSDSFDERQQYLQALNDIVNNFPDLSVYIESEFMNAIKRFYENDYKEEYSDIYLSLLHNKKQKNEKFDFIQKLEDVPERLMFYIQDKIAEIYPEYTQTITEQRIDYLQNNYDNFDMMTDLGVVELIAKISDDDKCRELLDKLFAIKFCNLVITEENMKKLPELFSVRENLGDDVLNILNKHQGYDVYFSVMADLAIVNSIKTEEVLTYMHARVQQEPRTELLMCQFYSAMNKVADELPKFRPMIESFTREAMLYKENNRKSLKLAAKLLNDKEALSSQSYVGKRTKKTKKNSHGWKNVDKINANELCVLNLGGDSTGEDHIANGYAKRMFEFLEECELEKDVAVYGVAYDFGEYFNEKKALGRQMCDYGHIKFDAQYFSKINEETESPQFIMQLFNKFILPRISLENGKKRRKTQNAAQNMAKFKIMAHCFGAYVALKLEELSLKKMEQLGYSEEERLFIQKQMQVLAISPHCPLGVSKSNMLSIISAQDGNVTHGNFFEQQIRNMVGSGKIIPLSYFPDKQGRFILVNRMYGDDNKKYNGSDDDEHNFCSLQVFSAMSKGGILAIKMARNFLQNGIERAKNNLTDVIPDEKWLTRNSKEETAFMQMSENGKKIMKEITEKALLENQKRNTKLRYKIY